MKNYEGTFDGTGLRVALAVSRFNDFITDKLLEGALSALHRHNVDAENTVVAHVPGAFELPIVAKRLASSGRFDAVIALGAVIRGETAHFDYVAGQAAAGIARASLDTDVPIIFGVITTENADQALHRIGIKSNNRGFEAAVAAIETATLLKRISVPV